MPGTCGVIRGTQSTPLATIIFYVSAMLQWSNILCHFKSSSWSLEFFYLPEVRVEMKPGCFCSLYLSSGSVIKIGRVVEGKWIVHVYDLHRRPKY